MWFYGNTNALYTAVKDLYKCMQGSNKTVHHFNKAIYITLYSQRALYNVSQDRYKVIQEAFKIITGCHKAMIRFYKAIQYVHKLIKDFIKSHLLCTKSRLSIKC